MKVLNGGGNVETKENHPEPQVTDDQERKIDENAPMSVIISKWTCDGGPSSMI